MRRQLGIVLILSAIVLGILLQLLGKIVIYESDIPNGGLVESQSAALTVSFFWPLVLLVFAIVGAVFAFLPEGKSRNSS